MDNTKVNDLLLQAQALITEALELLAVKPEVSENGSTASVEEKAEVAE